MSRALDDLAPGFREKVFEFLARCVEAGIQVKIIETLRSVEQQEENVRKGVSWTMHSKHILGKAIDVAPISVLARPNWAPDDPVWNRIGAIGKQLGLRWGGDWKQRDCPHFEV